VHALTNTKPLHLKRQHDQQTTIKNRTFPLSATGIYSYWDLVKLE